MANLMNCKLDNLPIKCLGLPIHGRKLKKNDQMKLVERVDRRLSEWKGEYLSLRERFILVNYVLLAKCQKNQRGELLTNEGYLFKGTHLCILSCSLIEKIVRELHSDGLGTRLGHVKNIALLEECYYRSQLKRSVGKFVPRSHVC